VQAKAGIFGKGVDQAQARVIEMADVARRQLGLLGQGDTGDQGVAQINRPSLGFSLGSQQCSLLRCRRIERCDALLDQIIDQRVELGSQTS